jgi:hypothetical protein
MLLASSLVRSGVPRGFISDKKYLPNLCNVPSSHHLHLIGMVQVNDLHTQVGELQSDAPAQRDQDHEDDHDQKDRDLEPSSPTVGDDEKPSEVDSGSYHEVERNIGVTKIEALYIVFGKGWKLAMLWLYVLYSLIN